MNFGKITDLIGKVVIRELANLSKTTKVVITTEYEGKSYEAVLEGEAADKWAKETLELALNSDKSLKTFPWKIKAVDKT